MSGGQPPNIKKKCKWNKNKMCNKTVNRRNKIPYRFEHTHGYQTVNGLNK